MGLGKLSGKWYINTRMDSGTYLVLPGVEEFRSGFYAVAVSRARRLTSLVTASELDITLDQIVTDAGSEIR